MTLAIYHVTGTAIGAYGSTRDACVIGVCADGKTDAARIVRERVIESGYEGFTHIKTERVAPAGEWTPGSTLWY